jgi:putative transposase
MTKTMLETTSVVALGSVTEERDAVKAAFQEVQSSFETFCLLAGIEAFQDLLEDEAADLCGERHQRHADRRGRRWGKARSPVAFHGGRVAIERPRVPDGQQELELPSLAAGQREDWLGRWAMNQMLINVSTRRFRRSVRLPDGDVASIKGDGTSKSAVVRGAVERETEGLAGNRSVASGPAGDPDLHVQEDLVLVAAVGIDATGEKHPLGLVEGATENAATVQALLDNLVERGLDPAVVRLFIIDGAKALSKAIRRTFGRNTPIQRCQVHKARNIAERLPKEAQARGSSAGLGDGGGPSS